VATDVHKSLVELNGNSLVCHIELELAERTLIGLPTTMVGFEYIVHEVLDGGLHSVRGTMKVVIGVNAGQFDLQIGGQCRKPLTRVRFDTFDLACIAIAIELNTYGRNSHPRKDFKKSSFIPW
jgi:hypothetical protein